MRKVPETPTLTFMFYFLRERRRDIAVRVRCTLMYVMCRVVLSRRDYQNELMHAPPQAAGVGGSGAREKSPQSCYAKVRVLIQSLAFDSTCLVIINPLHLSSK